MISHHPSETTLLSYAAGALPEGLGIVVATHLARCSACSGVLAECEAIGGALLDTITPVEVSLDPVLLDRRPDADPAPHAPPPVLNPELPAPLNRMPLGRWWRIAPGLRWRPLKVKGAAWAGLLLAQPGQRLPRHGHAGLELTCLLTGTFADGGQTYAPGDLAEPEGDHDNPPVVIGADPCLCVIASEGMRLRGVLGLAQRLVRP